MIHVLKKFPRGWSLRGALLKPGKPKEPPKSSFWRSKTEEQILNTTRPSNRLLRQEVLETQLDFAPFSALSMDFSCSKHSPLTRPRFTRTVEFFGCFYFYLLQC